MVNYTDYLEKVTFEPSKPMSNIEQLMSVLPPESAHLIPQKYEDLMKTSLKLYYPSEFKLIYWNKTYRFECHPLLPLINHEVLAQSLALVQ